MMPQRIQRQRTKGWRLPPHTICVSRPSRWGNPYRSGDRAQDVAAFERWLAAFPHDHWYTLVAPLVGKNLACWCPLDALCHADVLLQAAQDLADRTDLSDGRTWVALRDAYVARFGEEADIDGWTMTPLGSLQLLREALARGMPITEADMHRVYRELFGEDFPDYPPDAVL
jgi:Domain of unknown function (DUF4326)